MILTIVFSISTIYATENASNDYDSDLNDYKSNTEYSDIPSDITNVKESAKTSTSKIENNSETTTIQTKQASQTSAVYVSSKGDDKNNGQKNSPKATIKSALMSVSNGGTIYLKSGTYNQHNIYINKSITIVGSNSKNTILNADNNRAFTIAKGKNVTFYTFSIKNAQGICGGASATSNSLSLL